MAKEPIQGQCNICGEFGRLTLDHVPPKGVIHVTQMRLDHITSRLNAERAEDALKKPLLKSQNGIKFPTLCSRCNNTLLGTRYDPSLIKFVNSIVRFYSNNSSSYIPDVVNIPGEPHRIMRSVIGHIAALGKDRYKKGPETEALRDYFIDERLHLPEALRVYYWIYPAAEHVLIRDFAYLDFNFEAPIFTWLIKFPPIAFMVTWDEAPSARQFAVNEMSAWRGYGSADQTVPIPILAKQHIHPYWPEAPTDHSVSTFGKSAYVASSYKNLKYSS